MRHTLLGVLFFTALIAQGQTWDTIPVLPEHYNKKLEAFKKQKETSGKILFLGNSITEGGDFKTLLKDTTVINRGIGGDITFGVIARIEEVARFKPSKLFLLIGVNDLSKRIPENVILNNIFTIISLIHAQSPKTKVYVQSILPVNPAVKDFPKGYDVSESAKLINGQLANLTKRLNYTFVDIHKFFTDVAGNMDVRYTGDGLHLNAAGYALWIKVLKDARHL